MLQALRWNSCCRACFLYLLVSGCGMQSVCWSPQLCISYHMNLGGNSMKPFKADFTLYEESV